MSEQFIGEIKITPYNFVPRGWAACDGQIISIAQNTALFSLLGTTYGGNGQTTFGLPDLRGRTPIHAGAQPGGPTYALGQLAGEETHTLNISEMAPHTHQSVTGSSAAASATAPGGKTWGVQNANPYSSSNPNATMAPSALGNAGQSQPHSNIQPYVVLNFVIAITGIYPSRN